MTVARHTGEENKRLVRRFWEESFNLGNGDLVDQIVSETYRLVDLATSSALDRDDLRELVAGVQRQLEEPKVTIRDQWIADGGCIVSELTLRARPRGSVAGGDEWAEVNAVTIDRIEDGRVVETRVMWDAWTANERLRPVYRWRFPWW